MLFSVRLRSIHSFVGKSASYVVLTCFFALIMGFVVGFRFVAWHTIMPTLTIDMTNQGKQYMNGLLENNLPVLSWASNEEEAETTVKRGFLSSFLAVFIDPTGFWPGISGVKARIAADNGGSLNPNTAEKIQPKPLPTILNGTKDYPPIGIYCTHSAESYHLTSGADKEEGKNGGVYLVAQELQAALNAYGFTAVLASTIHDYPDWNQSYANSLVTMQELKEQYPDMQVFIDVHRDALPNKEATVTTINGESVAQIMFVVGTNSRANHPNWEKNLAFTNTIASCLNTYYPDFSRKVKVQNGRYNQHVTEKCILVEMGSTENTLEEAKRAAKLLANGLAVVLSEEIKSNGE